MIIILTSAISGILFMFIGFVLNDKRHLNILAVLLFIAMIISGVFQLQGCEIFHGKYPNMIETDPYRISFFVILCLTGIYYTLINRHNFSKPGSHISDYF